MRGRPAKYPWRKMKVGDTILITGRTRDSVKGCISHLKPMRFKFKQLAVRGDIATRVWRTA
jgi:hypothetical protein